MAAGDAPVQAGLQVGAGPQFAADLDNAGVFHPYVKAEFGASGTETHVDIAGGKGLPVQPDASAKFPVVGPRGSLTDHAGVIAAGGTSQQLLAANANRNYFLVWNDSDQNESIWINFGANAVVGGTSSIEVPPGGSFFMSTPNFVCVDTINVIAVTINHPYGCKEG